MDPGPIGELVQHPPSFFCILRRLCVAGNARQCVLESFEVPGPKRRLQIVCDVLCSLTHISPCKFPKSFEMGNFRTASGGHAGVGAVSRVREASEEGFQGPKRMVYQLHASVTGGGGGALMNEAMFTCVACTSVDHRVRQWHVLN